jgi:hypothetical protein
MSFDFFPIYVLVHMFEDWPVGTIIGVVVVATMVCMLALIVYVVGSFLDSCFLKTKRAVGKIVGKDFVPAHSTMIMIFNPILKMSVPQLIHHSDDWRLCIEVDGKQTWTSVLSNYYEKVTSGDETTVDYATGRFSGRLYVKAVYG